MKILVTGGRDFDDWDAVKRTLDKIRPTHVVHGGARGADALAQRYCMRYEIPFTCHPAQWSIHGRAAGHIRNQEMLESHLDIGRVVAFPGGKGTADMVRRAKKAGIPVLEATRDESGGTRS